jgi:hypothetical protein
MATHVIAGYKGYGPYDVRASADLYDCTTGSVRVSNADGKGQTGWRIRSQVPPPVARWVGGEVLSDNKPTMEWTALHSHDGPGFFLANAKDFTVFKLRMTDTFDGVRGTDATTNLTLDACWVTRHRDDLLEVDNRANIKRARLYRVFNELGSGHVVSSRRGNQASGATPPVTIEVEACVVELAPIFTDTRAKNIFSWSPDGRKSCRSFWKTENLGTATSVLFKNNIIRASSLFNSAKSTHALIEANSKLLPGSGGNILVWRGVQGTLGGIPAVSVPKMGGGTMKVPETLIGSGSNRQRILQIFQFTDDDTVWNTAVENWKVNVWANQAASAQLALDPHPNLETV